MKTDWRAEGKKTKVFVYMKGTLNWKKNQRQRSFPQTFYTFLHLLLFLPWFVFFLGETSNVPAVIKEVEQIGWTLSFTERAEPRQRSERGTMRQRTLTTGWGRTERASVCRLVHHPLDRVVFVSLLLNRVLGQSGSTGPDGEWGERGGGGEGVGQSGANWWDREKERERQESVMTMLRKLVKRKLLDVGWCDKIEPDIESDFEYAVKQKPVSYWELRKAESITHLSGAWTQTECFLL